MLRICFRMERLFVRFHLQWLSDYSPVQLSYHFPVLIASHTETGNCKYIMLQYTLMDASNQINEEIKYDLNIYWANTRFGQNNPSFGEDSILYNKTH